MELGQARRVCYEQMKAIIDFMGQHIDFAMGVLRTTEARHKSKKLWGELARHVNSIRGGTKKTPDMWSRYWSDFKNKLKKKIKVLNRKKKLGTSSEKGTKPLTKLEKRAVVILGPKFAKTSSTDESSRNSYSKHMPAEVKIENYQENIEFCKEPSESSDRLSDIMNNIPDGERDDESEGSDPEENSDEMELSINDSALQNLYPKWLIEVEKKRAEAELTRARAEEQRVAVAARNAEAALLQAEALKKLSEAATVQAEAVARIAMLMETRGHNNHHLLPI